MANFTGVGTTYSYGSQNYPIDMEDLIQLMSPMDIPFQGGANGGDPSLALPTGGVTETQYNWQDELLLTPRSTLGAAITDTTGTDIQVAAGDQLKFEPGHVIQIGGEWLLVTAYAATDHLTVVRGVSGTAATALINATIIGVGRAGQEGGDPPAARANDRVPRNNFTQIFGPTQVASSRTDLAVRKYGVTNEFAKQAGNRMKELAVDYEQALIYGSRFNDTGNKRRAMGGLAFFMDQNVDSSTTTLTEAALLAELQTIYDAGGSPEMVVGGSKQTRVISGFLSAGTLQVQRADGVRGTNVTAFESPFGTIAVKMHRWFKVGDLLIFRRDQAQRCVLSPMQLEPLAKTGDSQKAMIVAEYGFKFYRARHAGRFSALT